MKTIAIIPAGGKGSRTGLPVPKQYVKAGGKEIILYSLLRFQKNKLIDEIIIAAEPEYFNLLNKLKRKHKLSKLKKIVTGGEERQDSVYSALSSVTASADDLIIIHDAARPLLTGKILTSCITLASEKGNAITAVKARDTLFRQDENNSTYLNRDQVYYIQTPQIFRYEIIMKAMKQAYESGFKGTDESILLTRSGIKINFSEGSSFNIKITTPDDLKFFKKIIR